MRPTFIFLFVKLRNLLSREQGQDLVEYSLLIAVIALTCITGVSQMATAVGKLFGHVSAVLP